MFLKLPSHQANCMLLPRGGILIYIACLGEIIVCTLLFIRIFIGGLELSEATRSFHLGHIWILVQLCIKVKTLLLCIFLKRDEPMVSYRKKYMYWMTT
jgi:hypothetical protein